MINNSILIVDDDEDLRSTVKIILERESYHLLEASNEAELYETLRDNEISLIILDLMLEGKDGLSIMRELHPKFNIPVIMLTGKGDVVDKIIGLEIGADDYIVKPFNNRELLARIKSVLRRHVSIDPAIHVNADINVLSFLGWELDINSYTLTNPSGFEVKITGHEYTTLKTLLESAGRVLSRDQLLDHLNSDTREWSPTDRSLDVLIAKIRKKLEDSPYSPKFIRTVRQAGYMFIAKVEKTRKKNQPS